MQNGGSFPRAFQPTLAGPDGNVVCELRIVDRLKLLEHDAGLSIRSGLLRGLEADKRALFSVRP